MTAERSLLLSLALTCSFSLSLSLYIYIYISGCNLSGWADLGQKSQKIPSYIVKNGHETLPKRWGFFMFQCFSFFLIFAFFCLSFSSLPLLLVFFKPKNGPPNEVLGIYIYISGRLKTRHVDDCLSACSSDSKSALRFGHVGLKLMSNVVLQFECCLAALPTLFVCSTLGIHTPEWVLPGLDAEENAKNTLEHCQMIPGKHRRGWLLLKPLHVFDPLICCPFIRSLICCPFKFGHLEDCYEIIAPIVHQCHRLMCTRLLANLNMCS